MVKAKASAQGGGGHYWPLDVKKAVVKAYLKGGRNYKSKLSGSASASKATAQRLNKNDQISVSIKISDTLGSLRNSEIE